MAKKTLIKSKKEPTLAKVIQQNLTSFILGFVIVLLILLAGIKYFTKTDKTMQPSNISNVFEKVETTKKLDQDNGMTYIVVTGDDLCTISQQFYGDCNLGYKIAETNNITDANLIEVGQTLIIPELKADDQVIPVINEEEGQVMQVPEVENDKVYIVKMGDYLYKIAEEVYGDGNLWPKIASANDLVDGDFLSVGSKLQIPR